QDLADLEGLFARVRLRDEEVVDIHTQLLRVLDVEGMLRVDVGGRAATFLRPGHDVQGERGLAARFGTEDLSHPAARDPADADGRIEVDGAGRDGLHANARF